MINIFKGFFKQFTATFLIVILLLPQVSMFDVYGDVSSSFNLTVTKNSDTNGRADISLTWDEMKFLGKDDGTRYYIYRKDLATGKWEARGRYGDVIKVLNVYPDIAGSDQLKSWMDALSAVNVNVNIEVDKVKITDFNANPSTYLNTSQLNYDVVVFGFWDSNYGKDLSPEAVTVLDKFIENDGGVIFGHDTMETSTKKPYFKQIVEAKTSLRASATPGSTWPNWIYSYKIKVEKQGSVTTYPCDINGMSLIIPYSHTVGQIPTNPESVYMGFEKYTKAEVRNADPSLNIDSIDQVADDTFEHYLSYFYKGTDDKKTAQHDIYLDYNGIKYNTNAYLTVEENVAFIQCGHSSGKTNTAEQMVLANTIYALAKIFTGTNAQDQILDIAPPTTPMHTVDNNLISFDSTDTGSSFEYRIVAIPMGVEESVRNSSDQILTALDDPTALGVGDNIKFSNTVGVSVQGGLKTFRYTVDAVTSPTVQVDDTSLSIDGTIPVPPNATKDTYIHVAAYDNANNVSEIHSFNLWDSLVLYNVKEKYIDIDTGLEFQPETSSQQPQFVLYTPTPELNIKISEAKGYDYVSSNVPNIVVNSDESLNVINHYYKAVNFPLVTERYITLVKDEQGNTVEEKNIKAPITSYLSVGSIYTPTADVYNTESVIQEAGVDKYLFANTDFPSLTVSTDETKNVITHYYDPLLSKTLGIVEHNSYPTTSSNIYPFAQDIVLKQGTSLDISLPILANHTFAGYYTVGSPVVNADGSNKVVVGNVETVGLTWFTEEPTYFHYTRKTGSATVKIINSYTKLPIITFETLEANVGENLIITSDFLKQATSGTDFSTFIDGYKLNEFKTVAITNEGNDNLLVIELTPRKKTIIYYGIEILENIVRFIFNIFDNETNSSLLENITSGSAITLQATSNSAITLQPNVLVGQPSIQLLGRETYVFGVADGSYNGRNSSFNLIDKLFEGWAILDSNKNSLVNFRDPTSTNYVGYYREPRTPETYTYEVNYLNEFDNGVLLAKQDTITTSVLEKPSIEIKNIKDLNIGGNSVDFEPSYVEIIHSTLGAKTFSFTEDYLSFFNQKDLDGNFITGNYVVNVYYKPYVTINYVEEFLNTDLETVTHTRTSTLEVLYDAVTPIYAPKTKFDNEYLLYKFGGEAVDPSATDYSILPNQYHQTMVASYRPVVYNISIKAYAVVKNTPVQSLKMTRGTVVSQSYYVAYEFDSVPANDTITIAEPNFEGFSFQKLLGANDLSISSSNEIVSLKANPQKVLASMLSGAIPKYNIEAIYDKPSGLTVNHIDSLTNSTFKTDTISSVIGSSTTIPVYEGATRQYSYFTLDGATESTLPSNSAIVIIPTLEAHTLNIYYIDTRKYSLTVTSDIGGTTFGSTSDEYLFGDDITVTAVAEDNYIFDKWLINGINLDTSSTALSFTMPVNAVTLRAVFKSASTDVVDDVTDNTDVINDVDTDTNTDNSADNIDNTSNTNDFINDNSNTIDNTIIQDKELNDLTNLLENSQLTSDLVDFTEGDSIYWEYERLFKPYIHGYPDGSMRPSNNITRVEFVAIIYNLLGEEEINDINILNKFSDVANNAWYSQALAFSTKHNIVRGYPDGTFRPNNPITRAELAAVISRLAKDDSRPMLDTPFTDIENSWAKNSIIEIYSKGFVVGTSTTTYSPKDYATRAVVVTLVNRLIHRPTNWKKDKTFFDLLPKHWAYDNMMNAANGGVLYSKTVSQQLRDN